MAERIQLRWQMPYIPDDAVAAALAAYAREAYCDGEPIDGDERVIRAALEAASPVLERDIRSRIAASLRRAAAGRREYAEGCDGDNPHLAEAHLRLSIAADCHESSAAIIEDPRHLLSVIPSWRWTPEEHESVGSITKRH